ncbi:signal recognition particle 9 kDa protein-domain-containing protein [Triangularia verruculosa]|uniref:Signal recognition particle 9 kDa protein-domain-containing protein n=1 Tax=Triangularia verruculosa TaxID=2587418 RepID=A0AAN6XHX9_9PEZI|nr:signal recognition particle 9 kDa protein-domain-containing protein [Triangularia verruculosa]
MPFYEKSEDWLHHSSLLLAARPDTTRITTNYHLSPARRTPKNAAPEQAAEDAKKGTRGHLVITTFDPKSGASLKYRTSKAQEVGRLVQMLGNLAAKAAGRKEEDEEVKKEEDVEMGDGAAAESGVATPMTGGAGPAVQQQQPPQAGGGGGGGKGKKKKGKR